MQPTPAPCLGCELFCERRGGRRISKAAREKCRRSGGNLVAKTPPRPLPILQPSSTTKVDATYPCEHRSKESVGTADCSSCSGKVTLKLYKCNSPEISAPLCVIGPKLPKGDYARCDSCKVRTLPGSVLRDQIVVGVTTAPRKTPRLPETIASLQRSGFENICVFADGYRQEDFEALGDSLDGCELIDRPYPVGGWPNFYLSLTELYHRYPTAGLYAMFQDDVLVSEGLADYLLKTVDNSYPVWSPFNAEYNNSVRAGWQKINPGFSLCGAQSLVFTNEGVRNFLSDPDVVRYRRFPNAPSGKTIKNDGISHIDGVVGRYAQKTKKGVIVHHPSLVEHIGDTSVMHPGANHKNKWRGAKYFLGENYTLNAPPHVGCMMICGGSPDRKKFIRFAVEDFLKQDYPGFATLTIFDDHTESILETDGIGVLIEEHLYANRHVNYCHTPPRSVGAARQELLDFVQHQFPLLLQWDDDDRVPVDYLSYRVASCPPGAATILTRETLFFENGRPDVLADFDRDPGKFPGFPGTIMFPSCFAKSLKYPDQQRHEDTDVMRQLSKLTTLVRLRNDFDKYYRRIHAGSVSGFEHFQAMIRRIGEPSGA